MKKKLIILIILIGLFIAFISINKIVYLQKKQDRDNFYEYNEIKKRREKNNDDEINDLIVYSDNIIKNDLLSINYSFFHKTKSITGKIFIDSNKNLFITNTNENQTKKISTVKFRTLYAKEYEYDGIFVYLISEDNKLYLLSLEDNNIDNVIIDEITLDRKVMNFVDINFKSDIYEPGNTLFILCDNNKIYDIGSATRYSEDITSVFNSIYIYEDKTMSNVYGQMLEDKNGEYYKIKYVFYTLNDTDIVGKDKVIIITEDNRFLYLNDEMIYVYEFSEKVKSVKFDTYYPYVNGNLNIVFENNYKLEIKADCTEYYCVNKFAE